MKENQTISTNTRSAQEQVANASAKKQVNNIYYLAEGTDFEGGSAIFDYIQLSKEDIDWLLENSNQHPSIPSTRIEIYLDEMPESVQKALWLSDEGGEGWAETVDLTPLIRLADNEYAEVDNLTAYFNREVTLPLSANILQYSRPSDEQDGLPVGKLGNQAEGFPFEFQRQTWASSEILYLLGEWSNPDQTAIQEDIVSAKSAYVARRFKYAKYAKQKRTDFDTFRFHWMLYVVWQKCTGNQDFARLLLSMPDNAYIAEVEKRDALWALVRNEEAGLYRGKNAMGKILMLCKYCLSHGTTPAIDIELLNDSNIFILGQKFRVHHHTRKSEGAEARRQFLQTFRNALDYIEEQSLSEYTFSVTLQDLNHDVEGLSQQDITLPLFPVEAATLVALRTVYDIHFENIVYHNLDFSRKLYTDIKETLGIEDYDGMIVRMTGIDALVDKVKAAPVRTPLCKQADYDFLREMDTHYHALLHADLDVRCRRNSHYANMYTMHRAMEEHKDAPLVNYVRSLLLSDEDAWSYIYLHVCKQLYRMATVPTGDWAIVSRPYDPVGFLSHLGQGTNPLIQRNLVHFGVPDHRSARKSQRQAVSLAGQIYTPDSTILSNSAIHLNNE